MNSEFVMFVYELANMQHAEDWKLIASFLFFIATFTTFIIIMYDATRGKRRKVIGGHNTSVFVTLGMFFFSLAVFGLARTLDGVIDMGFLIAHPGALTTLSQQSLILELPLLVASIIAGIFIIVYMKDYKRKPYLTDIWEAENEYYEDSDIRE